MRGLSGIEGCPFSVAQTAVILTAADLRTTSTNRLADTMCLSPFTIERHWQDIRGVLDVRTRSEVMMIVVEQAWFRRARAAADDYRAKETAR